ncbi:MAG: hypothetical protein ABI557_12640, partial [Aureliella sp.]
MGCVLQARASMLVFPWLFPLEAASLSAAVVIVGGSTALGAMFARHVNYLQANPLEVGLLVICALWALYQREARRLGVFIGGLMLL